MQGPNPSATAAARAPQAVWSEAEWARREGEARRRVLAAAGAAAERTALVRCCRAVMRAYTTGFHLVSRFLPPAKRGDVEIVYASVRYPGEVVDTFPLPAEERERRLDEWGAAYERALALPSVRERLARGVPFPLAGFADVLGRAAIPPEHYRAFLAAMRLDARPRPFETLEDLVDAYVYGSAVVVGYFLAHVYGPSQPNGLDRALCAARELGIALQLTNFARDVPEDHRRGRDYLPRDWLRAEGIAVPDPADPAQAAPLGRVVRRLAAAAEEGYARAAHDLDVFAADSRVAIRACIDVYRALNARILRSADPLRRRESVPLLEKPRPLPASKWWRVPWAYLGP